MQDILEVNLAARMVAGNLANKLGYLFMYYHAHNFTGDINLNLFWHPKELLMRTHYEDVESWIEKHDYLTRKLNIAGDINISHYVTKQKSNLEIYKADEIIKLNGVYIRKTYKLPNKPIFKTNLQTQKNKVCFWRYDKNKLVYHRDPNYIEVWYKENTYTADEWCKIYDFLNENYNVVELEYRTPIREVFYHLSTCEFVVGYGGMYHVLSDYLDNPMISILNPSRLWSKTKHTLEYEHVCLPTIDEITDLDYLKSLLHKAKSKTRLAQSGLTEW